MNSEEEFYDAWLNSTLAKESMPEAEEPVAYHDTLEWKEKDYWKNLLDEFKRSYAIVLNYGDSKTTSMPVSGFCVTDLIDISELEYKRGVPSDEEAKNVIIEFTSYDIKEDGSLQTNPEYKIYLPAIKFYDLVNDGIGSNNSDAMHATYGREAYHNSIATVIRGMQWYIKKIDDLSKIDLGEKNITLDDLDATYVRVDPKTNESEALGSNYSIALYSLGKTLRKELVKTPDYHEEQEQTLGRTK